MSTIHHRVSHVALGQFRLDCKHTYGCFETLVSNRVDHVSVIIDESVTHLPIQFLTHICCNDTPDGRRSGNHEQSTGLILETVSH